LFCFNNAFQARQDLDKDEKSHNANSTNKAATLTKGHDDTFLAMSPSEYAPTFATITMEDGDADVLRDNVSKMWESEMDEWSAYMYESQKSRGRTELKDKKRLRSKSRQGKGM
jgi:hypothetical protein